MARLGRYFLPGQALHVIQRGNNRQAVFFHDEDRVLYRNWLGEAAAEYGCAIHAYVLMTNHVHLLVTPGNADSLPRTMQSLGRRYVRRINDTYGRSGTLCDLGVGVEIHNLKSALCIEGLSPTEFLPLHSHVSDELRKRGIVRSSNNPTGDLAEYLEIRGRLIHCK